jgi:hypothetical protein
MEKNSKLRLLGKARFYWGGMGKIWNQCPKEVIYSKKIVRGSVREGESKMGGNGKQIICAGISFFREKREIHQQNL